MDQIVKRLMENHRRLSESESSTTVAEFLDRHEEELWPSFYFEDSFDDSDEYEMIKKAQFMKHLEHFGMDLSKCVIFMADSCESSESREDALRFLRSGESKGSFNNNEEFQSLTDKSERSTSDLRVYSDGKVLSVGIGGGYESLLEVYFIQKG